ncbi:hypothetical protein HYC85_008906 [Camellia sinensis]|uniref:Uncharacterized protein n=1 Tax=Camellia sinensis TaxID=4442 RepID=A0A7J7HT73_CAMSI|nr:hypothetical protein HYC85_008906 [Camellia sinensis]
MSPELHATREKNGIYIPRDHYMNDEAAKKQNILLIPDLSVQAMAQKIECMEVDSGFKNKQQLVEELSEKLEITQLQRGFEQTRQVMLDLKESYSQSNEKIKEKDYLKAMTEKAFELHAELGNVASELEVVHETVVASVTEQGLQLKVIEEATQLFVSTKATAHSRTLQMTRLISSTILNFFESLSLHFSKLTLLMEETRTMNSQELCGLEKKLEEYAINEERQLLDKVA